MFGTSSASADFGNSCQSLKPCPPPFGLGEGLIIMRDPNRWKRWL